jgi:hypothetical protein
LIRVVSAVCSFPCDQARDPWPWPAASSCTPARIALTLDAPRRLRWPAGRLRRAGVEVPGDGLLEALAATAKRRASSGARPSRAVNQPAKLSPPPMRSTSRTS